MAPRDPAPDGTIGLVVSQFPRFVDAYFLREISALAARGLRFRIFSLRQFDGAVVHSMARPFLPVTTNVPFLLSRRVLAAQVWALARRPGRYLGALARVVGGCWRSPRALARAAAVFPKSVYFARLAEQEGIAHVHANWATHPAAAAWIMSRVGGVPWSFAGHASDIYLERAMLGDKLRAARFAVTCTAHNREYLAGIAGPAAAPRVLVSYHGVDLERFRPAPRPDGGPFRILAVGTLHECKGFDDLVAACGLLDRRGVPVDCQLVGDGAERARLERQIAALGLEGRVRITGYVSQEELVPLYQRADVVALPARSESHFGIPNVLLEGLAAGTPVVCTPLPSLSEVLVDGEHGLYVPERAPEALADALETLYRDPARRRAMGLAGRRRMEAMFDTQKNVGVLEALFRAALGAGPAAIASGGTAGRPAAVEPAGVRPSHAP
jgi:glycosyltransferase involved in cell wall biosynthesis